MNETFTTPGFVTALTPGEAGRAGVFDEDGMSEKDALESVIERARCGSHGTAARTFFLDNEIIFKCLNEYPGTLEPACRSCENTTRLS